MVFNNFIASLCLLQESMYIFARFSYPQSPQWQLVARSPFALRPGLSQEDVLDSFLLLHLFHVHFLLGISHLSIPQLFRSCQT